MPNTNASRKSQKLLKSKTDFSRDQLADLLENMASRQAPGHRARVGAGNLVVCG